MKHGEIVIDQASRRFRVYPQPVRTLKDIVVLRNRARGTDVWALREVGPIGFLKELFAPKGESSGFMKIVLVVVFFAVGCLEVISILFRPVSLSFRLYGNTFAGENMLETMSRLVPGLGWLLPIPFYFLEMLVGVVQALVFMLLTAVFTMLICQHEEGHPRAHH